MELVEKYAEHFLFGGEKMSLEDAKSYLETLSHIEVELKERKIKKLEEYIKETSKETEHKKKEEDENILLAEEYVSLTKKWESLGATFVPPQYYSNGEYHFNIRPDTNKKNYGKTRWFYNDKCFYEWESGNHIKEMIVEARKADKKIEGLIKALG